MSPLASPLIFVSFLLRLSAFRILTISAAALIALQAAAIGSPLNGREGSMSFTGEFVASTWFGEGGLPHNSINDVVRDPRGFLWLGTQGGVARFDGRYFVEYPMPQEFALGHHNIRSLAIEDENTVVVITGSGRLVRLRDGKYEMHPANQFINDIAAVDLAVDDGGALWIGTLTPTLMRWDGNKMEYFRSPDGIDKRSSHFCVVPDGKNRTWIGSGDFLGWYDKTGLHRCEPLSDTYIMAAKLRTGGLWIASNEKLSKFEDGKWKIILEGTDWPAAQVGIQDLYETSDGVLWVATRRSGMYRLIDGRLTPLHLHHDRVESITEDIDNNVWLGTNGGGLIRLKRKHHVLINTTVGMPRDVSSSVTEDETGALWFANQAGGVVRIKHGKTLVIPTTTGEMPYATNICADQRGTIWIGAPDGVYSTSVREPDHGWALERQNISANSNIQIIYCTRSGDVWISWRNGQLGRLRNGQFRTFTPEEGLPKLRIAGIAERQSGNETDIWVASVYGRLFKLSKDGEHFEEQSLPAEAKESQINAVHVDAGNRLWLGTSLGLLLWDEKNPRIFKRDDGFPDDVIYQVISDNYNRLWLSSRRGIFHVEIARLLASKSTPEQPVSTTLFGRDDNLEGLSGMIGGQPMTWKSRDGRLWFATYRGVVGFEASAPALEAPKKYPVYIDALSVNGHYTGIHSNNDEKAIRVGPNALQLGLSFAALNFSEPERTQVRRMLEGFDLDWVDATGERSCMYSRLPPGKYTFRVQTITDNRNTPTSQCFLSIEVAAAWWQTQWFRLAIGVALILAVAWVVRLVSNRILRQRLRRLELEKALDQERARIARDLHDELGSRMSRIGFAADSIIQEKDARRQSQMLTGLTTHARGLVEDLHRIVWTVNPQNDSWQELAEYISRYTHRMLADTQITCTVDGIETIPDIPVAPDVRHHIVAITKEALNNMLKHSRANHVNIQMNAQHGHFHMNIGDNGRGFEKASVMDHDGFGLENMRARMEEVGGQCTIDSQPGQGTQITLNISLKYRPPPAPSGSS